MAKEVEPDQFACPGCGRVKPRAEYYEPPTKHTRVSHYCRECTRALRRLERRGIRAFEAREQLRTTT